MEVTIKEHPLKPMERHPLSAAWGDMSTEGKQDLIADVKEHGVREPVTIFDGKLLDGFHRYAAAMYAEIGCPVREYDGDDAPGFVISENAHRRHLPKVERAMAVARVRAWRAPTGGRPADEEPVKAEAPAIRPRTTQELADEAGVSVATMERAKAQVRDERGESLPKRQPSAKKAGPKKVPPAAPKPEASTVAAASDAAGETIADALDDAAKGADTAKEGAKVPEAKEGAATAEQVYEASLEEQLEEARERIRVLEDAASPEAAGRVQVLSAKQEEIRVLKSQVSNWQVKYEDVRRDNARLKRQVQRLQGEVTKLKKDVSKG